MLTEVKMCRKVKIPCETNFREILVHFFNLRSQQLSFTNVSKRDVVFDNFSFMESPTSTQGCPIDVVY